MLAQEEMNIGLALTFDYGQRAASCEIRQAKALAEHFGIKHRSLILPWFSEFQSSALLKPGNLPRPGSQDLNNLHYTSKSAKAVWVPNRNGIFIECAAAFAEENEMQHVIVGFNEEEAVTFPDNTEEYLAAVNGALKFSTSNQITVVSPTAKMNKREIVRHAKQRNFPFELLWSCYEGKDTMCGTCESCMRLKRALSENEVPYDSFFENAKLR